MNIKNLQSSDQKPISKNIIKMRRTPIQYQSVMTKNLLKVTNDRLSDYRSTLKEIIDAKNGKIPVDSVHL